MNAYVVRYVVYSLSSLAAGYGMYCGWRTALTPTYCFLQHDYRLSHATREELQSTICSLLREVPSTQLQKRLLLHNPAVREVKASLRPIRTALVTYTAATPIARVTLDQKNVILTAQKTLVPESAYDQAILEPLVTIQASENFSDDAALCAQWLQERAHAIFDQYKIHWINKMSIVLIPHNSQRLSLVITHDTPCDQKFLTAINALEEEYAQEKKRLRRSQQKQRVHIDARFGHQIIVKKGEIL